MNILVTNTRNSQAYTIIRALLRIPLNSASDSGRNRPAFRSKAAGGSRSEATLEFFLIA